MPKNCQKSVKFKKNGMGGGKIWVKMVGGSTFWENGRGVIESGRGG